jgi:hypothetical protein
MLNPFWRSSEYIKITKIRIFNSNEMAVLLDGAEMWKFNEYDIARLEISMPQEITTHLLANKDIKTGTILQMQNIPSR